MLESMFHISLWTLVAIFVIEKLWLKRGDLEWFRAFFLGYTALYALAKMLEMP